MHWLTHLQLSMGGPCPPLCLPPHTQVPTHTCSPHVDTLSLSSYNCTEGCVTRFLAPEPQKRAECSQKGGAIAKGEETEEELGGPSCFLDPEGLRGLGFMLCFL